VSGDDAEVRIEELISVGRLTPENLDLLFSKPSWGKRQYL
jgi:hypothetical protein